MLTLNVLRTHPACSHRVVGDLNTFNSDDPILWNTMYKVVMDKKYAKNTRNFSTGIVGTPVEDTIAPIYVIPRTRGGPSYLSVPLIGVNIEHVQYCPISKGFPMQDVSSFTLGPIVGEGLCLVNAAFSKCITIGHIEGGGSVDFKRKTFWKRSKNPHHNIVNINNEEISVDGVIYGTHEWLHNNENLWFPQWDLWRKSVAMCSKGDFHWTDNMGSVISYRKGTDYLNFIQWKKECYIRPSYELLPTTDVYKFLYTVWFEHNIPLGLVHPKARNEHGEQQITSDFIRNMYDSPDIMCCQPYVVAGRLMNVPIYEE